MSKKIALRRAAIIALVVNLVASLLLAIFLRAGVDRSIPIAERLAFITTWPGLWIASWFAWIAAALTLIHFFVHWALWLDESLDGTRRGLILFATLIGSLGLMSDTLAETLFSGLLPQLAREYVNTGAVSTALPRTIVVWERLATLMTGFLGNGLYCIGGFLLNLVSLSATTRSAAFKFGISVWLSGFALSAASFADHNIGMIATSASTMALFVLFCAAIAVSLSRNTQTSSARDTGHEVHE